MEAHITCHVCKRVGLTPWITACSSDKHIMCAICAPLKDFRCPACSDRWGTTTHKILASIAAEQKVRMHCAYSGCDKTFQVGETVDEHTRTCPFRVIRCLYERSDSCKWIGTPKQFFVHFHNRHFEDKKCNRVHSDIESLDEWIDLPNEIEFDVSSLIDGSSMGKEYYHFLRTTSGYRIILNTCVERPETNTDEKTPTDMYGWYHRSLILSPNGVTFCDNTKLTSPLRVLLNYQKRTTETRILSYDEDDISSLLNNGWTGHSYADSSLTYLYITSARKMTARVLFKEDKPRKRARVEEESL